MPRSRDNGGSAPPCHRIGRAEYSICGARGRGDLRRRGGGAAGGGALPARTLVAIADHHPGDLRRRRRAPAPLCGSGHAAVARAGRGSSGRCWSRCTPGSGAPARRSPARCCTSGSASTWRISFPRARRRGQLGLMAGAYLVVLLASRAGRRGGQLGHARRTVSGRRLLRMVRDGVSSSCAASPRRRSPTRSPASTTGSHSTSS